MKIEELQTTLLGRIKLSLCQLVTGERRIPVSEDLLKYYSGLPKQGLVRKLFDNIWFVNEQFNIDEAKMLPVALDRVLKYLEIYPIKAPRFFSTKSFSNQSGIEEGLLVFREELQGGGQIYCFVMFKDDFLESGCSYWEMRASQLQPEPFLSMLQLDGSYQPISRDEFDQFSGHDLILTVLLHMYHNPIGMSYIPLDLLARRGAKRGEIPQEINTPEDKKYDKLVERVSKGQLRVSRAFVTPDCLRPKSIQFCNTISDYLVEKMEQLIQDRQVPGPLVYWDWNTKRFIVSDDYLLYLVYLKMEIKKVPVIIMGHFPATKVEVTEVGGRELLPGSYRVESETTNEEVQLERLKTRLREKEDLKKEKKRVLEFIESHSEIWIGINQIAFGLLIRPFFSEKSWKSKPQDELSYTPWTIGHVLVEGLVVPKKDEVIRFNNPQEWLSYFLNTIVRSTQSEYQYQLAKRYCKFVNEAENPLEVPLLIPEYRFLGKIAKHKYRLDFTMISFQQWVRLGIELSPWSVHGKLTNTQKKTTGEVNREAKKNFEREIKKAREYFHQYRISVLSYSDSDLDLKGMDEIFEDIAHYLKTG